MHESLTQILVVPLDHAPDFFPQDIPAGKWFKVQNTSLPDFPSYFVVVDVPKGTYLPLQLRLRRYNRSGNPVGIDDYRLEDYVDMVGPWLADQPSYLRVTIAGYVADIERNEMFGLWFGAWTTGNTACVVGTTPEQVMGQLLTLLPSVVQVLKEGTLSHETEIVL